MAEVDSPSVSSPPSLAWVIPLISKDVRHIATLCDLLSGQSTAVDQLVLVHSGLTRPEREMVNRAVARARYPVTLVGRRRLHTAAENRNCGVRACHTQWVTFFDADDLPHPQRNEILKATISRLSQLNANPVILHGMTLVSRDFVAEEASRIFPLVKDKSVHTTSTLEEKIAQRLAENHNVAKKNRKFRLVSFSGWESLPVAHGPLTAKRSLLASHPLASQRSRRGEDVRYLNDLAIDTDCRLWFIPQSLMAYRVLWETPKTDEEAEELLNPFRTSIRLAKLRLTLSKKFKAVARRARRRLVGAAQRIVSISERVPHKR